MLALKHILFPVDFSERCEKAAPFVDAMAKRFGAKLTLLSTIQPLVYGGLIEPSGPMTLQPDLLIAGLESRLNRAFPERFQGVAVERVVQLGDPALCVAEFVKNHSVDLVMLPTHGYGPFRRLLLGSVAAKILHDVKRPVWTDAHLEDPDVATHVEIKHVLCAVDRSADTARVMLWANDFAKAAGATLSLFHAVPGVEAWPDRQFDREFEEELSKQAHTAIETIQRENAVDAPLVVKAGDVGQLIHEEVRSQGANLVVIGRHSDHGAFGRLLAHAYDIIRQAHCPVISV